MGEPDFIKIFSNLPTSAVQYFDGNLPENNEYVYELEAVGSGAGNSTSSDSSNATTTFECSKRAPFPPPELSVNSVYAVDGQVAVSLGWTDCENEESYELFRRLTGESYFAKVRQPWWERVMSYFLGRVAVADYDYPLGTSTADILNYVDYSATDDTSYDYRVIAVNNNGETMSNIITVPVPIARPGNFTLSGRQLGDGTVYLYWTEAQSSAAGGTVKYTVQRDSDASFSSPGVICTNITALECYDNSPSLSEEYYRVEARNKAIDPTYSNPIRVLLFAPTWKEIAPF